MSRRHRKKKPTHVVAERPTPAPVARRSLPGSLAALLFGAVVLTAALVRFDEPADRSPPVVEGFDSLEPVLRDAITARLAAVAERPRSGQAHGDLGVLYEAHGYAKEALACYGNAARLDQDNALWHYLGALLTGERGDAGAAESGLRRVLELEPDYAPAHNRLALLLLDRNANEEAARAFQRVVDLRPNEPQGYVGLARARLRLSSPDEAVELALRVLELAPGNDEAAFIVGRAYRQLGRMEDAKRYFAASGRSQPTVVKDPWLAPIEQARLTQWMRLKTASAQMDQGDLQGAVDSLALLLVDYPDSLDVLNDLAIGHARLGAYDEADRHLAAALELDPAHAKTYVNVAVLDAGRGEVLRAIENADKALAIDPRHAEALEVKGKLLLRTRRFAEAAECLQRAAELDPRDRETFGYLGLALVNLDRLEDAATAYENAVRVNPQPAGDYYRLGLIQMRLGRVDKARAALQIALRLEPGNVRAEEALDRLQGTDSGG